MKALIAALAVVAVIVLCAIFRWNAIRSLAFFTRMAQEAG
jgi:hypothetical protein